MLDSKTDGCRMFATKRILQYEHPRALEIIAMKKLWRIVGFSVFLVPVVSFFNLPESHVAAQIPEYTSWRLNSDPAQTREKPFVVGQSTKRKAIVTRSATDAAVAVVDVRNLDDQN